MFDMFEYSVAQSPNLFKMREILLWRLHQRLV